MVLRGRVPECGGRNLGTNEYRSGIVDDTRPLPGLSPFAGKAVLASFEGGRLCSEGGLLALREIERRVGLAERLAGCLTDPRMPERGQHQLAGVIRFRILM